MEMMMHTYSNPRMEAVIENWPSGKHRVTAVFKIQVHPTHGERATRGTTDPRTGLVCKPKVLTYARKCRIVDGDDGRTYLLNLTASGHISVFQSNMQYNEEAIFPDDPRYAEVRALFDVVPALAA
jgi:hypothetical protein